MKDHGPYLPEIPEMPEMNSITQFLHDDSDKKIDNDKIRVVLENFLIDYLSTIKPYSTQFPKYATENFDIFYSQLINSIYSDNLQIRLAVPLYNLQIEGRALPLRDCTLKSLTTSESSNLMIFKHYDDYTVVNPTSMLEITKTVSRADYNDNVLSPVELELINNYLITLNLFQDTFIHASDVFIFPPLFVEEPAIIKPLNINFDESSVPVVINNDARKGFRQFDKNIKTCIPLLFSESRLNISYNYYQRTMSSTQFEYKLLNCIIGFEVLFGSFGRDTTRWVSLRAARLVGAFTSERPDTVYNDIFRAYNARNAFVHNGIIKEGTQKSVQSSMVRLTRYFRKSIVCLILLMKKYSYKNIMKFLDTAILSTANLSLNNWEQKVYNRLKKSHQ